MLNFLFQVALNFTFDLRKPPDLQWGAKDSNGNWNGMINEVLNGKTDFGKIKFF